MSSCCPHRLSASSEARLISSTTSLSLCKSHHDKHDVYTGNTTYQTNQWSLRISSSKSSLRRRNWSRCLSSDRSTCRSMMSSLSKRYSQWSRKTSSWCDTSLIDFLKVVVLIENTPSTSLTHSDRTTLTGWLRMLWSSVMAQSTETSNLNRSKYRRIGRSSLRPYHISPVSIMDVSSGCRI